MSTMRMRRARIRRTIVNVPSATSLALVLVLLACGDSSGPGPEESEAWLGHYVYGLETNDFHPCGMEDEIFWIKPGQDTPILGPVAELQLRYSEMIDHEYEPLFVELRGRKMANNGPIPAPDYVTAMFQLDRLVRVEKSSPDDCEQSPTFPLPPLTPLSRHPVEDGVYHLTRWTTYFLGNETDLLARGATLELEYRAGAVGSVFGSIPPNVPGFGGAGMWYNLGDTLSYFEAGDYYFPITQIFVHEAGSAFSARFLSAPWEAMSLRLERDPDP